MKFKRRIRQLHHHWILHPMKEALRNPLKFFAFCRIVVVAVVDVAVVVAVVVAVAVVGNKVFHVPHTDGG